MNNKDRKTAGGRLTSNISNGSTSDDALSFALVEHSDQKVDRDRSSVEEEQKRRDGNSPLLSVAPAGALNSIVITDLKGAILLTTTAFTELTGYLAKEVIGQMPHVRSSRKQGPVFYRQMWDVISGHKVWSGEIIGRRRGGASYTEEMTITPIESDNREELRFVTVTHEVTRRNSIDDQFRHAQQIEAVGLLAGGIAHDLNNLLSAIGGYAELLGDHIGDDVIRRDTLREIRFAVKLAGKLTGQIVAFIQKRQLQPQVLSLNLVVSDIINVLCRIVGEDIILSSRLDPAVGNIRDDAGQLQQLIMNFTANARDAMPRGGTLTISTMNADVDRDDVRTGTLIPMGRYVKLTLRDSGAGMDAETRRRAFEPFFTTKRDGRGTGLGLATVCDIVKRSGGFVSLTSKLGKGTTAEIYFKRVDEEPELKIVQTPERTPKHGSETILLVEDCRSLRKMIRIGLESNGYSVITGKDGTEGLEAARVYHGAIHLLVTDVIMPGMDGLQVAVRIAEQRPSTKVLYMSGHTKLMLSQHGALKSEAPFISKPFDMPDFLAKVRKTLK
jgi:two-component system, cell cycle sensor histidine kinase and response regulator CckA